MLVGIVTGAVGVEGVGAVGVEGVGAVGVEGVGAVGVVGGEGAEGGAEEAVAEGVAEGVAEEVAGFGVGEEGARGCTSLAIALIIMFVPSDSATIVPD